ncbi:MAG: hypothetical protein HYT72_03555 [Candidatus Aenigmarchaeota archaeon]|nr:hypothetical protein [Candidatus Aenigmarchaeota archaeon]
MKTVSYPLRIPKEIVELAALRSKEEYVDQSTALRQLLHLGAEEYVLEIVSLGRISIGKAAELLKVSVYDVCKLAEKHGVKLGGTVEQGMKSRKAAKKYMQ